MGRAGNKEIPSGALHNAELLKVSLITEEFHQSLNDSDISNVGIIF